MSDAGPGLEKADGFIDQFYEDIPQGIILIRGTDEKGDCGFRPELDLFYFPVGDDFSHHILEIRHDRIVDFDTAGGVKDPHRLRFEQGKVLRIARERLIIFIRSKGVFICPEFRLRILLSTLSRFQLDRTERHGDGSIAADRALLDRVDQLMGCQ